VVEVDDPRLETVVQMLRVRYLVSHFLTKEGHPPRYLGRELCEGNVVTTPPLVRGSDLPRPPLVWEPLESNGNTGGLEINEDLVIASIEAGALLHECILERVTALSVYTEQYNLRCIVLGGRIGPSCLIFALGNACAAVTATDASIWESKTGNIPVGRKRGG